MRYLVTNADGSVAIMEVFPLRAVIAGTDVVTVAGQRRYAPTGTERGRCVVYGRRGDGAFYEITVGDHDFSIGDLEPDTVPGVVFQFPDPRADVIAKWPPAQRAAVVTVTPLARDATRPDRVYRDAWTVRAGVLGVDMVRARELHRTFLRQSRAPRLAALDAQQLQAMAQSEPLTLIEVEKQRLRDLPQDPAIEAAMTTAELRTAWPADFPPLGTLGRSA